MNVEAESPKINWRKLIPAAIVLLVAAFIAGQPYVERWLGVEPPLINGQDRIVQNQPSSDIKPKVASTKKGIGESDKASAQHPDTANSKPGKSDVARSSPALTANFKLQELRDGQSRSPAGLIYRRTSQGEHRIDHVMRHATDDPNRPVHGVFEKNDKNQILALIDSAYELTNSGSSRVKKETNQDQPYRVTYTVDMQRTIGFKGGRSGQRDHHPPLHKLRLVIDNGNQVVTAYPDD